METIIAVSLDHKDNNSLILMLETTAATHNLADQLVFNPQWVLEQLVSQLWSSAAIQEAHGVNQVVVALANNQILA